MIQCPLTTRPEVPTSSPCSTSLSRDLKDHDCRKKPLPMQLPDITHFPSNIDQVAKMTK